MKKVLIMILVFIGLALITISDFDNGVLAMNEISKDTEITIFIDGKRIDFDAPLQIVNNRVIVPAWQLYEVLGATAEWREEQGIAVASIDDIKIAVRSDYDSMVVNGKFVELDVTPRLVDDKLFVPIRAICENFGAKVEWEETAKTVKITTNRIEKSDLNSLTTEQIDINDIWRIEEKEDFVIEMAQCIAEKCEYGEKVEILNEKQRVFYIVQTLEMEVNNGGFSQFFFNNGVFANELVASFEKIGAIKTAEICKKAVSIFGEEIPTDRDEIQDVIVPDDEKEEERIDEFLNECDDSFYKYEDDLVELSYKFIINNKEQFLK